MKFLAFLFLSSLTTWSYSQSVGKVIYEEKMDMHRRLPPDREEMKDMIPQFHASQWELIYNGDESVYQHQKQEETEVNSTQGNTQMTMRFGGRDNRVVYKNLADANMIDSRDFMQKQFLITGAPTERKWKIGKNSKSILGYNCLEATFQADSATTIVAWFAPQIQQFNGPSDYQGLPGLILQVDTNDGERMITATEIQFENVDTSPIVAPKKGKEVTSEEFNKIREEKMKEMGMQGNGGPMQIMITRH